jgi:predicted ATPase
MKEISREVTLKAKEKGIDQLFLTEPLLFSKLLLEGRAAQFLAADKSTERIVFFDRGIPDVFAYMDYFKTTYPAIFIEKSKECVYQKVFLFSPWKEIYISDNERYENFEQASEINDFLIKAYEKLGYQLINVPFDTVENRTNFIINSLEKKA